MEAQKVIGIVGGGQLGRMLTQAALPLGFKVAVVDPTPNCPAAQAGAEQIVGGFRDAEAIRKLAGRADYLTIESEHVNTHILEEIEQSGLPVNPRPQTVALIQDKYRQKEFLQTNGFPVAPFLPIDTFEQANEAFQRFEGAMMLKTRQDAFDGRGNAAVSSMHELKTAWQRFGGTALYAEKLMPFSKELAVIAAKDMEGTIRTYPVAETTHERSICVQVQAPAAISQKVQSQAVAIATRAVSRLSGAGVFAVELFLFKDDSILINEIAPRVHNSGHYTMDACLTSQFEQHIRAISSLPLGDPLMVTPAATMINVLGEHDRPTQCVGLDKTLANPAVRVHLYGKSPTKIDRKMGHINVPGETLDDTLEAAKTARWHLEI